MRERTVFCAGVTSALSYAAQYLKQAGVTVIESPRWDARHLLLDVPSFRPGTPLTEEKNLDTLLGSLPGDVTIWGGNLDHPALREYPVVDLLKDETYLAQNAAITAHCALQVAAPFLHTTWAETPTLILGWGRIGKCLAKLLKSLDCPVTVASGSEAKQAALRSLGYDAEDLSGISSILHGYRLIFNTVPKMILPEEQQNACQRCVKIDLASKRGIAGEDVIWARGLPGTYAPESSGKLIAETFLRLEGEGKK